MEQILYRSGNPTKEFAEEFQTLVHYMDKTLDKLGELMWNLFPVVEMQDRHGGHYSYSWMKRGCHYFYVILPHIFRMRGRVGSISARAGESAQYDGVDALHQCTPIKGSDPEEYMRCGVRNHFGRSKRTWAEEPQREAQARAKKKFLVATRLCTKTGCFLAVRKPHPGHKHEECVRPEDEP